MKTPKKRFQRHLGKFPDAHHEVDVECICEVDGKTVRFTVAEMLAANDTAEIFRTRKGAFILVNDKDRNRTYRSFVTRDSLLEHLRKEIQGHSTQDIYRQLDGPMSAIEEV